VKTNKHLSYNNTSIISNNFNIDHFLNNSIWKLKTEQFLNELLLLESNTFYNTTNYPGAQIDKSDPELVNILFADSVKYITDYRINKTDFCDINSNLNSILFVWSRVDAFDQREAIRKTWAQDIYYNENNITEYSVKILFVLGLSENNTINEIVSDEDSMFGDILQLKFIDSYYNCTLKSIAILRWTLFHCNRVNSIMKADDDMVINLKNLQSFLMDIRNKSHSIYGLIAHGWGPFRNKDTKWYISRRVYPGAKWPDFIVGAHIMTSDCIALLYCKALYTLPAIAFEDVYITGVLAKGLPIKIIQNDGFVRLDWIKKKFSKKLFDNNIVLGHDFSAKSLPEIFY